MPLNTPWMHQMLEACKVEDHVPIFREHIQVQSSESSSLGSPAKKLMADAKGYKLSPNITMDSTLYDFLMDPGVPSTPAGSRDSDPEVPAPVVKAKPPAPAKVPATVPKAPPASAKAPKSKPVAKPKSVAEPNELLAPVEVIGEQADDEAEEEEKLNREQRLRREAAAINHQRCHYPKNPTCPVCQRSRMYKRPTTKVRTDPLDLEDRGSLEPVTSFGERVAIDSIIVRKLKDGRENVVQVIRDEFSGWLRAYPIANRGYGFSGS